MTGGWLAPLLTLSAMEIVLGIDNIVFIAILAAKLPREQQGTARKLGLLVALVTRLLLLFSLSYILKLDYPIFHLTDLGIPLDWLRELEGEGFRVVNAISWRDLILIGGGLFLIAKATYEIHDKLEGAEEKPVMRVASRFGLIMVQIAILDIVFSLDSVITAVGMARELWIMVTAMIIAVGVMLLFSGPIASFVHRHPTVKVLALSFLILIGVLLVADGTGHHIDKGYVYFAMVFSLIVELINLRMRKAAPPVELHEPQPPRNG
jgi:predicted tellurium resistance membrane protein TerC